MKEKDVLIRSLSQKEHFTFDDLCDITTLLRGDGGCPWDREQTHESIRRCMIEEAYEVVEAIDNRDPVLLCEELGDVLFQIVFHTDIERESDRFKIGDVIDGICRKMIRRHPHVFGAGSAIDGRDALSQWEAIKTEEKQRKTLSSRLRAIPPMMPALLRAQKVNEKIGTSLADADEIGTLLRGQAQAFANQPNADIMGELLFSISKFAAATGLDAEKALSERTEKVISEAEKLKFYEKN